MGLHSDELKRVEYVLTGWHSRLPDFYAEADAEYTKKEVNGQTEATCRSGPSGILRRHNYIDAVGELLSKGVGTAGNPWGLEAKKVLQMVKKSEVTKILSALELGEIFNGEQDYGCQEDGHLGSRRRELHAEGSLGRLRLVLALVTFLELMMILEPPNAKELKHALKDGPLKEHSGAGYHLLGTLHDAYPIWQELVELGQFRLRGLGASLSRATKELLATPPGQAILTQIPNLRAPKQPLRADEHGLLFMPFETDWSPAKVEYASKAAALLVVCAAELCDASYQRLVKQIVDARNQQRGEHPEIVHTPAPPKKYDRIMNKHGCVYKTNPKGKYVLCDDPDADHGSYAHPRAAGNVDTVRCGITCVPELAPALHKALGEFLGTRIRTKNNLKASEEEARQMYYYLAILDNYEIEFKPSKDGADRGVTHGDVAAALRQKADEKFDVRAQIEMCHTMARWIEENHASTYVKVMCETQIILPMYLEGRKRSHLPYKIVRCSDPDQLRQDLCNL